MLFLATVGELHKPLVAFLLQEVGAREKLAKENAIKGISPSAEGEEASAASTAQAFEKACAKLFIKISTI